MSNNKMIRDTGTKRGSDDDKEDNPKVRSQKLTPQLVNDDHSGTSYLFSDSSNDEIDNEKLQSLTLELLESMREAEEYYADDESDFVPRGKIIVQIEPDLSAWQEDVERRYRLADISDDDVSMADDDVSRVNETMEPENSKDGCTTSLQALARNTKSVCQSTEETYIAGQRRQAGEALVEVYDAVAEMTRDLGIVWDWQVENNR